MRTLWNFTKLLAIWLLIVAPAHVLAQTNPLVTAEVFLNDPDVVPGAGIPLVLDSTAADPFQTAAGAIDLTGFEPGPFTLYMRFQDETGAWSVPLGRTFNVTEGSTIAPLPGGENAVVAAEAFIDIDPGEGNGVPLTVAADGSIDNTIEALSGAISLDGLSPGVHVLHMRFIDRTGVWSSATRKTFVVMEAGANPNAFSVKLAAAEGIIDGGAPIPLAADDGAFDDIVETVTLTAAVSSDYHSAQIRFLDRQGFWSDNTLNICDGTGTLSGYLLDATTNQPLSGVTVYAGSLSTITGSDGFFVFQGLTCEPHEVSVVVDGYVGYSRTFDLSVGVWLNVNLTIDSTVNGITTESAIWGDPVNTATGNYVYQRRDLEIAGIGIPFRFDRTYNSREASGVSAVGSPIGYGWSHSYNTRIDNNAGIVTITWGDGHTEAYSPDGEGGYTPQYGVFDTLVDDGDGTFSLLKRDKSLYEFNTANRLAAIIDKNGNALSLSYTGDNLTGVVDTAGRSYTFDYDASGRLTQISDPVSRTVKYAYDANGDLISATDPKENVTAYTYDGNHQILTVVDPRGNTVVTNTYDGVNRVVTYQTDAKGNPTTYSYEELDRITTITDALNNVTLHQHDELLRLVKEEDARGGVALYEYDERGNREKVTDKNGNITQYGYDTRGNVTSKTDALDRLTTITYDDNDNPLSRTDAMGNVAQFAYDANGNLIQTTDALGNIATITYLPNGLPESITDPRSNPTTNTYDAEGNLIAVEDALTNVTQHTYDGVGRRLSTTDMLTHTTSYNYDANDNLLNVTDPLSKVITHTYDKNDNKISTIDRKGNITQWEYDEKDLLISETDALNHAETYTYDALDRRLSRIDRLGNTTQYAYDAVGNLIEVTNALGNKTSYSYDLNGKRLSQTDANGNTTSFTYDALNRLVQTTDAMGNTILTAYDPNGNRENVTDALGNTSSFTYDVLNRLTLIADALGNATASAYDAVGNPVSVTDPLGHSTTSSYDALNRPVTRTDALGHSTSTTYDAVGRVSSVSDANGQTTAFAYDALDRLAQVTDANGGIVVYAYDANGNRSQLTDPNGNTTTYAHDVLDRRISTTEPLGHVTSLVYDTLGNLIQKTDPKGQVTQYLYNSLNRLTDIDYAVQADVAFDYDAIGKLTVMTDGLGATNHLYDALNRRTVTTDPFGKTVGYGYDANGNRTGLTYPGSKTVTYAYDAVNRLTTVTDWLDNATSYDYDAADRLVSAVNANGTTTAYTYDDANRLTGLTNAKSDATVINAYSYILDAVGNHLSEERDEPLAPAIFAEIVNDTHDAENRLVGSNAVANSFDANGNMTAKGANIYVYDATDRLTQTNIGGTTTQYQYDGLGNRYARIREGVEQRFVLDTNTALTNVLAETDATGVVQSYNVYGLGLIARIQSDDSVLQYHYDSRGSTIALSDGTGVLLQQYAYDPFGRLANTEGTETNPFGYLGRYGVMDEGGDLNYIRARYYDSEQQRFVSKDVKIGQDLQSQTLNRYAYALNSPIRLLDISGFSPKDTIDASAILVEPSNSTPFTNILLSDKLQGSSSHTNKMLELTFLFAEQAAIPLGQASIEILVNLIHKGGRAALENAVQPGLEALAGDDYVDFLDKWQNVGRKTQYLSKNIGGILSGATVAWDYYQHRDEDPFKQASRVAYNTTVTALSTGAYVGCGGGVTGALCSTAVTTTGKVLYGQVEKAGDFFGGLLYETAHGTRIGNWLGF